MSDITGQKCGAQGNARKRCSGLYNIIQEEVKSRNRQRGRELTRRMMKRLELFLPEDDAICHHYQQPSSLVESDEIFRRKPHALIFGNCEMGSEAKNLTGGKTWIHCILDPTIN